MNATDVRRSRIRATEDHDKLFTTITTSHIGLPNQFCDLKRDAGESGVQGVDADV